MPDPVARSPRSVPVGAPARRLPAALLLLLTACAAPPVVWESDLDAALGSLDPGALLVVQFVVPGQPESDAQEAEVGVSEALRQAMVGARAVRIDATVETARFRRIFDLGPLLATCIFDADGRMLTAELGYVGAGALCALLRQARAGRERVAAAAAALAAHAEAPTPERGRASLALAQAYQATGNLIEARRLWKVVAMLPASTSEARLRVATACNELARLALADGDALDARDWLDLLREAAPEAIEEPEVQLTLARQARLNGRTEVAMTILRRLRTGAHGDAAKGDAAAVLFELAGVCHDVNRNEEAVGLLEELIGKHPQTVWSQRAAAELQHLATHARDTKETTGR